MNHQQNILVTGANGFIGSALTRALLGQGFRVRMTGQSRAQHLEELGAEWFQMGDLEAKPDWRPVLEGIQGVVHLAGMAHRIHEDQATLSDTYDIVNHLATRSLAQAIAQAPGVEKLLFASSVAVYGDSQPFPLIVDDNIPLHPLTPYGLSKLNAERALHEHLAETLCRWAILRPVLIYGPGNPGNMARLGSLIGKGVPVPVTRRPNRRSLLYLGNLLSAVTTYLSSPCPPTGKTWLIADGEDWSTEQLIQEMSHAMGLKARTVRLPSPILRSSAAAGSLMKRLGLPAPWTTDILDKLLSDFYVDATSIQRDLQWHPPFTPAEGLARTFGKQLSGNP